MDSRGHDSFDLRADEVMLMRPNADWIGWCLHYIMGIVVGGILGAIIVIPKRRLHPDLWMETEFMPYFIGGIAMIVAGFASIYGDELWQGEMYRTFEPHGPDASPLSRTLSFISIIVGVLLCGFAIGQNFGWM